jgi:hypothetical protein
MGIKQDLEEFLYKWKDIVGPRTERIRASLLKEEFKYRIWLEVSDIIERLDQEIVSQQQYYRDKGE